MASPETDRAAVDAETIAANPTYQLLKSKRSGFGWILAIIMLVVYYGYVSLIAFEKELLAIPIGSGVITWGVPVGFGVIIFTIVITIVYVMRANKEFDDLTEKVKQEVLK
ncbi:MAG: DUF485 domain-containing protein [Hyphomonadaceae bacterium]